VPVELLECAKGLELGQTALAIRVAAIEQPERSLCRAMLHRPEFAHFPKNQPMTATIRSNSLRLRITPQQKAVLRLAAEVLNKSMTDFILDSAYQAAEQTLLDQRLFPVTGQRSQALLALLGRPAQDNPGLKDLFSRRAPWVKGA